MKVVVTGGGGFVGSHVVERFADSSNEVVAVDSLIRSAVLGEHYVGKLANRYNWDWISGLPGVTRLQLDVRDFDGLAAVIQGSDVVVHTAGQVAVTTSMRDPVSDFEVNVVGTHNVLEAARRSESDPVVIFCSTNKVYGDHVNDLAVRTRESRYEFASPQFALGVPETLPTDNCHHSPYGVSKLAADLYVQEYARSYGLRTGVFRMSCIYGDRQFGLEDQGWVAHFVLSALQGRPLTIFGDGKQLRDVLFVSDLIDAYWVFVQRARQLGGKVYNIGGGPAFTLSLLELLSLLESKLGHQVSVSHDDWRPADQKVYVSDIRRVKADLGWSPRVSPADGVSRLLQWASGVDSQ